MTVFDPAAARARCKAASPGPWTNNERMIWQGITADDIAEADRLSAAGDEVAACEILDRAEHLTGGEIDRAGDAEFIAAARTDLPAALDEIERLTALLARVARPATQYGSRVYHLTDDFVALTPYLSDADIALAAERPSEEADRVAAERAAAHAEVAALRAALDRVHAHCDAATDRALVLGEPVWLSASLIRAAATVPDPGEQPPEADPQYVDPALLQRVARRQAVEQPNCRHCARALPHKETEQAACGAAGSDCWPGHDR